MVDVSVFDVLDELARRRHGDRIVETATVACTSCDDYEITYRYAGDPDAGSVGGIVNEGADLETCPVCGAETEVAVS